MVALSGMPNASSDLKWLIIDCLVCFLYRLQYPFPGAHTIGQARCLTFRDHIYNDSNIDSSFAKTRRSQCPKNTDGRKVLAPLDLQTPTHFDNKYYKNLLSKKGLLHSDQQLYNGGSTDSLVKTYSNDGETFFKDFVTAMIKMGDIDPLTGSSGEIRKNCRKPN